MPTPPSPDDLPRFAEERQARIAATLRDEGRVEVAALAATYGCSEDTIRRDLRRLAAAGLVQKTHGGAVALQAHVLPVTERLDVRVGPKRAIARAAAERVSAHQTLFIDAGSTTLALAQQLAGSDGPRPLTIVTAALDVAVLFAGDPRVRLVLAGGTWAPETREFTGTLALETLRAHRADWAFLGACALHPDLGLTTMADDDAQLKRAMIAAAATVAVLADATKHGTVAPYAVADLSAIDLVLTDATPDWLLAAVPEVVHVT